MKKKRFDEFQSCRVREIVYFACTKFGLEFLQHKIVKLQFYLTRKNKRVAKMYGTSNGANFFAVIARWAR
jgi:hypothetical protein